MVYKVPLWYTGMEKLGMIRKPANFISSISGNRDAELTCCNVALSEVFASEMGISSGSVGGSLGHALCSSR